MRGGRGIGFGLLIVHCSFRKVEFSGAKRRKKREGGGRREEIIMFLRGTNEHSFIHSPFAFLNKHIFT
jgi:hypothetical protein